MFASRKNYELRFAWGLLMNFVCGIVLDVKKIQGPYVIDNTIRRCFLCMEASPGQSSLCDREVNKKWYARKNLFFSPTIGGPSERVRDVILGLWEAMGRSEGVNIAYIFFVLFGSIF